MRGIGCVAVVVGMLSAGLAAAREPWQLSAGPFTTAADVTEHSRAVLDWRDLRALVGKPEPDWPAALQLYAAGRHFKNHSLGIVADNYNGRLAGVLPRSSAHFGTPSFQVLAWTGALMKTGGFRQASDAERVAFLDGAAPALMLNWARYELGEADRKAKTATPNWALTNGAPKNWNEIFAFHVGHEGRDSPYALLQATPEGARINERLLAALAAGQEVLVRQSWPQAEADKVRAILDQASLLLLRQALERSDPALARRRAAGAWLAGAEPTLAHPEAAKAVAGALSGAADGAALASAASTIGALIAP